MTHRLIISYNVLQSQLFMTNIQCKPSWIATKPPKKVRLLWIRLFFQRDLFKQIFFVHCFASCCRFYLYRKTRCIFYWGCILPALFLRCRHNCECFDFFNSGAFILFQCKKSSGLLGTVRSFLPWYSFNHRSIYRIEVCNEKTSGQGKCADFRSWYGRFWKHLKWCYRLHHKHYCSITD